jgi:acyl-coenzyme A synthetase/AMP-(fatty) acid ligase
VVRGSHIALGYRRRPELTRAAFLPPGPGESDAAYRTGDLGRWRSDGGPEYLGRKDSQVKVRGHRVELTEIEQVLLRVRDIGEAVVVQRAGPTGAPGLAAYLVSLRRPAPSVRRPPAGRGRQPARRHAAGAFVLLDRP